MYKYSGVRRVAIAAAFVVVGAVPSWSARLCVAPVDRGVDQQPEKFHRLNQDRWIVETKAGLYQFVQTRAGLLPYEGPALSRISHVIPLGRDVSILLSEGGSSGGVFRAQSDSLKIQELSGSEPLRFTAVGRLSMGALVGTDRGLYRIDSTGGQFQETTGSDTGRVSILEQVDENAWLVAAALGIFRYDGRNSRVERLSGGDTGEVTHLEKLADGGWIAGTERGLFRIDAAGRNVSSAPWKKGFRVAEIVKLGDGSWLVRGEQGLFVADAQGRRLDSLDEDNASSWRIQHSDERGAILQNKRLLYVLPLGAKKLDFVGGEALSDIQAVRGLQDGWLVGAQRGLFRLDLPRRRLIPLRGPAPGRITFLQPLKTGAYLVGAEAGLFRTDTGLQAWEPVPGRSGRANLIASTGDGSFLVGAQRGLFRLDAEGQGLMPMPGAKLTGISAIERLATGDWLIQARGALATLDKSARTAVLVPGGSSVQPGSILQPLPDGRMLLGTAHGVLTTISAAEAGVTFEARQSAAPWRSATTIVATLAHPCAGVAGQMELKIRAEKEGAEALLPARVSAESPERATLEADIGPLGSGQWTFQLVSAAGGLETRVGQPSTMTIATTMGEWLWRYLVWFLAGVVALQVLTFSALLVAARWRPATLRSLRSTWAKILLWPTLILPHSFAMQRWTLASWFRSERDKAATMAPSIDVPMRSVGGQELKPRELLDRVGSTRRVWLQGRSGMGKTTALTAWRKAFFGQSESLFGATRRYGFFLVPIPAPFMESAAAGKDAEATVLGLAADALAQHGMSCDHAWLRAMIRGGRMALVFDSPTQDVQDAIVAFAGINRNARILVTSERTAPHEFEAWQLPHTVERETVEPLLQLWLGAYSGSQLTNRLARDDVLSQLCTYYDVRLAADIVTDDPSEAVPADRIALYRAPFARAAVRDPRLQDFTPLNALAWTATLERRSVLRPEEIASLDDGFREALLSEGTGILREADGTFAFDHDQLRFFLAAEHLVKGSERVASLIATLESSHVWDCTRQDQEELWRFLAAMLPPDGVTALWRFSLERPERAFLQCALHKRGLETNVFPIGLGTALSSREDAASPRLRTVET